MKVDPPIPISLPFGDGNITEMDDGGMVTVMLESGEVIKIDGNLEADLYRTGEFKQ